MFSVCVFIHRAFIYLSIDRPLAHIIYYINANNINKYLTKKRLLTCHDVTIITNIKKTWKYVVQLLKY